MELKDATWKDIMEELGNRFPKFIFFGIEPDGDKSKPNFVLFRPWARASSEAEAIGLAELYKDNVIHANIQPGEAGPYQLSPDNS